MNSQLQTLYVLGTLAATATVLRISVQGKARLIDWVALGSIALLVIQLFSMIELQKF